METDIKPCPFCGVLPTEYQYADRPPQYQCEESNCRLTFLVPLELWNRRPIEDELGLWLVSVTRGMEGEVSYLKTVRDNLRESRSDIFNQLEAAQTRIAELEAQLTAVPQWTRITEDPATWPKGQMVVTCLDYSDGSHEYWVAFEDEFATPAKSEIGNRSWLPITPPQVEP